MKGGIAIEQILYIFLMVIIILVASSFLLKALGIDIFGFIEGLFAQIGKWEGKVLHIKIDPDQGDKVEIWEFHLTDERKHINEVEDSDSFFMIDRSSFEKANCTIFTTDENAPLIGDDRDEGYIYYVKPGARIQEGCGTSLADCIKDYVVGHNCISEAGDVDSETGEYIGKCPERKEGKFNLVECRVMKEVYDTFFYYSIYPARCDENDTIIPFDKRRVEIRKFESFGKTVLRGADCKGGLCCAADPTLCNLLLSEKVDKEVRYAYEVKHGLICDSQKRKWIACGGPNCKDETCKAAGEGGKKFKCVQDGVYWRWEEES